MRQIRSECIRTQTGEVCTSERKKKFLNASEHDVPSSRWHYRAASSCHGFIAWYCSEPRLAFNRIVVVRYCLYRESRRLAANTINHQLAALRRLAHKAADSGC